MLEDIDCGGLEDIVKIRRKDEEKDKESNDYSEDEAEMDFKKEITLLKNRMNDREDKEKYKTSNKDITLSDILEVFDGVMETKVIWNVDKTKFFENVPSNFIILGQDDGDHYKPP